jgi:hypothetical protein
MRLMNTITGPPVNLAITPDRHLALVANRSEPGFHPCPNGSL